MGNPLLDQLEYDDANGAILLGASRYLLIRPETLGEIHDQIERRWAGGSAQILFAAGHTGVSAYLKSLPPEVLANRGELVGRVVETGSRLGWGRISLCSLDVEGRRMELEVSGSAFVRPRQGAPTCHMFRGVFAALGEAIFGGPVDSMEMECAATGAPTCAFVVRGKVDRG